jgi:hypothetical protein
MPKKPSDYIKKGWCQRTTARGSDLEPTLPQLATAVQWCIVGAIYAAYANHRKSKDKAFDRVGKAIDTMALATWNDNPRRTQQEVIDLLLSVGE